MRSLAEILKPHVSEASRNEFEDALNRVLTGGVVTVYVTWWFISRYGVVDKGDMTLLAVLTGWLVLAIVALVSSWISPAPSVSRRVVGMVADVGMITFALWMCNGQSGAQIVLAYLFVILGNGFRYGPTYLHTCQVLSLVGFSAVLLTNPWWSHEVAVGLGWLTAILVLPGYVGMLTDRIKRARRNAEEALKACVEQQPAA